MTTVSSTQGAAGNAGAPSAAAVAASAGDLENRFLTLLVSQLRNQDPLNPMDNAQLTTQLAQISTVSGIGQLNSTMTSVAAALSASQAQQAAGLVGHTVLVAGNQLALADGAATGGFSLAAAGSATVTIKDASGVVVRTLTLADQPPGVSTFAWDGKTDAGVTAGDGAYTFSVSATSGTSAVAATTLAAGPVIGLIPGTGGAAAQLQVGTLGRFDTTSIYEIL